MIEKVYDFVAADQKLTIWKAEEEKGISFGPCKEILMEDLGMRCVSAADSSEGARPVYNL